MVKIAFLGAGSTVFARNVLGDCMCTPVLRDAEIALYDIDAKASGGVGDHSSGHQQQCERGTGTDRHLSGRGEPEGGPEGCGFRGERHPGGRL